MVDRHPLLDPIVLTKESTISAASHFPPSAPHSPALPAEGLAGEFR